MWLYDINPMTIYTNEDESQLRFVLSVKGTGSNTPYRKKQVTFERWDRARDGSYRFRSVGKNYISSFRMFAKSSINMDLPSRMT